MKKYLHYLMSLLIIISMLSTSVIQAFAHSALLDITYDNCVKNKLGDDIGESWYYLTLGNSTYHLSHEEITIKYYFEETSEDGTYRWTDTVSEAEANDIKTAYANSMKKWNNVYFYSYNNADGSITKHKIINITEGTAEEHNLSIFPAPGANYYATTSPIGGINQIEEDHKHYSDWKMVIYVYHFSSNNTDGQNYIDIVRDRCGAHELGHVLGLFDVDTECNRNSSDVSHHHELLMGYGSPLTSRSTNITYKDIAGVAVTRGFHTDNDHKWLNCGLQDDGKYKLVCSICNGVKNVVSLIGYTYVEYGACNNDHSISSGNMLAVASYESKDYYKCEYCRYVAPYNSNVTQNYVKTNYNNTLHKCVNNVHGLEYMFYEEHAPYVYIDKYNHSRSCSCGIGTQVEQHTILASDIVEGNYYAPCMGCGYLLDLRDDSYNTIASITQVSVNGSYILPGGIVVLVDEDIQAYLDGTLVFYHPDSIPAAQ